MTESRLTLELRADDNNNRSVTMDELESWIAAVKRHTNAANVDIRLLVGCLRVEQ